LPPACGPQPQAAISLGLLCNAYCFASIYNVVAFVSRPSNATITLATTKTIIIVYHAGLWTPM